MQISETKKSKKYATLVTYLVAVVCLLLGLFLPMFNGNGILALCLPDVFNQLTGNEIISTSNKLNLAFTADLFGLGVTVDVMAYVILLYAVVTVLALLALVPIGLTFNKESKVPVIFEYAVLTASSIILSLYIVMALQLVPDTAVSINMLIAFGGSILALAVLSCINKKGTGAVKVILCLLSAVALLLLFDLMAVIPALKEALDGMGESGIFPALFRDGDMNIFGIAPLTKLFNGNSLTATVDAAEGIAQKMTYCVATACAIMVIANFLIDVISLCTNGKKAGILFNVVRYGLALLLFILLIIMILVSQFGFGLFTIILTVIVALQLFISIIRLIMYLKKVREDQRDEDFERQKIRFIKPIKQHKQKDGNVQDIIDYPEFVGAEPIVAQPIDSPVEEQMSFIEPAPEAHEETEETEPVHENPDEVQIEMDGLPEENEGYEKPVYISEEVDTPEPEAVESPEEVEPVQPEEPTEPETAEASEEPEPEETEPVQPEETEPEQSEVPEEPAQPEPVYDRPVYTRPYEPPVYTRPVYEQPVYKQPEPVQPVKKVEEPAPAPAPAPTPAPAPSNTVPVRVEVQQPEKPRTYNPYIDRRIYSELYEHTDSFINKLTPSEKEEFRRTFIERANGDIGNIPEYVYGGSNKKFFSAVFIYLGRIRGIISDELLNKMFKELNML